MYVKAGTVKMTKGAISGNTASVAAGVGGGGGVYVLGGSLTLTDVFISGNQSKFNGGGIDIAVTSGGNPNVKVTGGTIGFNTAANSGGGIYTNAGSLTLNSITIGNNVYNVQVDDNTAASQGSGLFLGNGSTTTFNGVTVEDNNAPKGGGKGIYWQQPNAKVNPDPPTAPALTDPDDNGNPIKGP